MSRNAPPDYAAYEAGLSVEQPLEVGTIQESA